MSVTHEEVPVCADRSQAAVRQHVQHSLIRASTGAFAGFSQFPLVEGACGFPNLGPRPIQGNPVLPWDVCAVRKCFLSGLDGIVVAGVSLGPLVSPVFCCQVGVQALCSHKAPP